MLNDGCVEQGGEVTVTVPAAIRIMGGTPLAARLAMTGYGSWRSQTCVHYVARSGAARLLRDTSG